MLKAIAIAAVLPTLLLTAGQATALTKKQKMETCSFGADDQKLTGAKRKAFLARCMSNKDDKRGPTQKKN
jgi:hypothetical protein